jgi:hypothetical protein
MQLKWHEVTWYSKLGAALVLFGFLPALSFIIGRQIQAIEDGPRNLIIVHKPYYVEVFSPVAVGQETIHKAIPSPDGHYLATENVVGAPGEGAAAVFLINVRSKERVTKKYLGSFVAWSADSTKVLIFSGDDERRISVLGVNDTFVDSGLPNGTYAAALLPDGSYVYASSTEPETEKADLVLRNTTGRDTTLVKGNNEAFTNFQWDGSYITFVKSDYLFKNSDTWRIHEDGTGLSRI